MIATVVVLFVVVVGVGGVVTDAESIAEASMK
jgi:hypothetical protein